MSTPSDTLAWRTGEVLRLGLQLRRSDLTYEDLTGRTFSLAVQGEDGETVLVSAAAEVGPYVAVSTAIMTLTGANAATLLENRGEAADYRATVVERVTGGMRAHLDLRLNLTRGVDLGELPPEPPDASSPIHLYTLRSE